MSLQVTKLQLLREWIDTVGFVAHVQTSQKMRSYNLK
jgi:hypothetical protein